ncbi:MAG: hypothetical protein GDA50_07625 [Alphaproteobacteria bacterium GM202ARS2]|nr:hypothetical protein [Alphaproteobacteria bacterium GM202ARS2]
MHLLQDNIILLATAVAIGLALDKLLLPHQETKIRDILTEWWYYLDNLKITQIIPRSSQMIVKAHNRIFGKLLSIKWIFRISILSIIATCILAFVGSALESTAEYIVGFQVRSAVLGKGYVDAWIFSAITDYEIFKYVFIENFSGLMENAWDKSTTHLFVTKKQSIPLNIIFDIITVFFTIYMIGKIQQQSGNLKIMTIVLADILFALILFNFLSVSTVFLDDTIHPQNTVLFSDNYFKELTRKSWYAIDMSYRDILTKCQAYNEYAVANWPIQVTKNNDIYNNWYCIVMPDYFWSNINGESIYGFHPWAFFVSSSVIIPSIALYVMVGMIVVLKPVAYFVRAVFLQIFALSVEKKESIFFFTSIVMGIVLSLLNAVVEIWGS